ncbi:MAG: type II 3-dehydroquinate dehydratase [Syntrophaceticus sp.]
MARVLVLHGPNLNLLGEREEEIYGWTTLEQINRDLQQHGETEGVEVVAFQSNHEGELINQIHNARGNFDVIILNPGAFTHYSYAIYDAVRGVNIPVIEVHLSNINARDPWRNISVVAPAAWGQISGFGPLSYHLALTAACHLIKSYK